MPYTDRRQTSPGRKRGRVRTSGRTQLGSRLSVGAVLEPGQVFVEAGRDQRQVSLALKGCRKTMGVFARDQDLFDAKLSVRAMAGILWIFCSNLHLSPDKSSLLLEVGHRVIRFLFQKFAECFVPLIDKLNGSLTVISFRSVGRAHGIVWLRYLAVVRRGSALVWIERLPYRISSVGQGGPISPQEMREALLLDADEAILAVGSVCHTDGAKAYRNLASLLDFETLKLGHTCVKHKPPHPEFTKRLSTRRSFC